MSSHSIRLAHLGSHKPGVPVRAGAWATLTGALGAMVRARQTRRLLAAMDDRTLADIGLGRGDAMTEAARPMWDIDRT